MTQLFSHYPALPLPAAARVALRVLPEHPCNYFPGRPARTRAFYAQQLSPLTYHALMDAGFRRSGRIIYQPVCRGCRDCIPIRVPVGEFHPRKSQRRSHRRNLDLSIECNERPHPDDESFELYRRYLRGWHGEDAQNCDDRESFEAFLYESPVKTLEFRYRDAGGRLLAVGICDECELSLSSVYFFFDPAESARALGTFGALSEIEFARARNIAHYYLGYWLERCATMSYKSAFRPAEVLCTDGIWRRLRSRT